MMIWSSIKKGTACFFSNHKNIWLGLIPILIGILLYFTLGAWLFLQLKLLTHDYVMPQLYESFAGTVVVGVIGVFVSIAFYFLFNWAFLIVVFFISYPFYSKISANTYKLIRPDSIPVTKWEFSGAFREIGKVLLNLTFSVIIFTLTSVPFLAWLALIFSAILISIQFIDHSWIRERLTLSQCIDDLFSHPLNYFLIGLIALFIFSIPVLNVLLMPVMVSIYTVLWYEQRRGKAA